MDKKAIIAIIQNNPRAKVGQGENIYIPLTVEQRNYLRESRKQYRRMHLQSMERNASYC